MMRLICGFVGESQRPSREGHREQVNRGAADRPSLNFEISLGEALSQRLLVEDALLVGLIATWLGTAMHRGYRGVPSPTPGS